MAQVPASQLPVGRHETCQVSRCRHLTHWSCSDEPTGAPLAAEACLVPSCRQEFTLTEEEGEEAGTDMERGQLLTLSALSSHSLPAPTAEGDAGEIALQPVAVASGKDR